MLRYMVTKYFFENELYSSKYISQIILLKKKEERQNQMKYYCEKCDFGTNAQILFNRHLETNKHINL